MIKTYENFIVEDYPDNFNGLLIRGARGMKDKYIDDPSRRTISIGSSQEKDYVMFINNYKEMGLQDPTKSVHMLVSKDKDDISYYGNIYKVCPEINAKFGFCKETRNGGLGSTYWFSKRTAKDFFDKDFIDFRNYKYNTQGFEFRRFKTYGEYIKVVREYQQMLIDNEVIGEYSYDQLVDICENFDGKPFQVWTESPCLLIKI